MGVSGKWIKALIGLKKQKKSQRSGEDGHKVSTGKFRLLNKLNVADSSSTPHQVQSSSQTEQHMREEWAATRIQTAFRGFLARRSLIALKGLVRLQAIVKGQAVRKTTAITFRSMQAIMRVQADVRARRVRIALESQSDEQKLQQQQQEAHVREIENSNPLIPPLDNQRHVES